MKKYTFTVIEDEDGLIKIDSKNDGFNQFAIVGILESQKDVETMLLYQARLEATKKKEEKKD